MKKDRIRLGNKIRLTGYLIQALFVGGFLLLQLVSKDDVEAAGKLGPLDIGMIAGILLGAAIVATGTFLRSKPPSTKELMEEAEAEARAAEEEAEYR